MPEIELSASTILWVEVIIGIVVGMAIRDVANNFVQGVMFKWNSQFQEGDHIIIDGDRGVIVSVGYRQAVFRLSKEDGTITWRYVPNARINILRLEKIVEDPTISNLEERVKQLETKDQ